MNEYNQLMKEHKIAEAKMLFDNGLSCAEIAEMLDMPDSNIRSMINN